MDNDGITLIKKLAVTKIEIYHRNHHTWGCPVYVLEKIWPDNIAELTKWEPRSSAGICLGHYPFHEVSLTLFLYTETGHVSSQFHVVFDDEISIVLFMRKIRISPNWIDLVQQISQKGVPEYIEPKENWLTLDLEEDTSKNRKSIDGIFPIE